MYRIEYKNGQNKNIDFLSFVFSLDYMNQINGIECKNKIFILEFRFSLDY